jgi:hypothetical protein
MVIPALNGRFAADTDLDALDAAWQAGIAAVQANPTPRPAKPLATTGPGWSSPRSPQGR